MSFRQFVFDADPANHQVRLPDRPGPAPSENDRLAGPMSERLVGCLRQIRKHGRKSEASGMENQGVGGEE